MTDHEIARFIGRIVLIMREGKGWTQIDLARRSGVPQPTLSFCEAGRRGLTVGSLVRIAAAFGVPVSRFLP